MDCTIRLDWDMPYEFVKRNKAFFLHYIYFVFQHIFPKIDWWAVNIKASSNGNTHVFIYLKNDNWWCKTPQKYMLESMLGGDLARTWYNYNRWKQLGIDIDILFSKKELRDVPRVEIPWRVILDGKSN